MENWESGINLLTVTVVNKCDAKVTDDFHTFLHYKQHMKAVMHYPQINTLVCTEEIGVHDACIVYTVVCQKAEVSSNTEKLNPMALSVIELHLHQS